MEGMKMISCTVNNIRILVTVFLFVGGLLSPASAFAGDPAAVQDIFERVFNDVVRLPADMIGKVLATKLGTRTYVDSNNDNKPEEVWYVDPARRHPETMRPVLVRALDEDGDLVTGGEPDLDSDLYVADWRADGIVDAVLDYTDRDGDQDVDEMAMFFPGKVHGGDERALVVWWGDDIGDDNLLWYDIAYTYNQDLCQFKTHFGGSELFCAFNLTLESPEWIPLFENPFLFYDHDHDGVTEEVVRFEGRSELVGKLRYSFDADHDATPDNPRDFDVSISAHAKPDTTFDPRFSDRRVLRGIPTGPFLEYHVAPHYSREQEWADMMLTWDENDLNIDGDNLNEAAFKDTQERWEGIIAKGNEWFKQIGGPSVGCFNKRFELAETPKTALRVYVSPVDNRLHLFGANRSWLVADFDCDQKPDMRYEYRDEDQDGYLDTWAVDANLDDEWDESWKASADAKPQDIRYTWPDVSSYVSPVVKTEPGQLYRLVMTLKMVLGQSTAEELMTKGLLAGLDYAPLPVDLRERLLASDESMRYYFGLARDRLMFMLRASGAKPEVLANLEGLRGTTGNITGMTACLEEAWGVKYEGQSFIDWRAEQLAKYEKPHVAWAQDWIPPNIGWESEECAYRAYWGQFDFFGKSRPGLVLNTFDGKTSYHDEQEWGIDALHVNRTCGLGGIALYIGNEMHPVYSPNGEGPIEWSKRLVSADNDHIAVELEAKNVGSKDNPARVWFLCETQKGHRNSSITVTAECGPDGSPLTVGIGLCRLPQERFAIDTEAGVIANRGFQDPLIGEIGMGIVFPVDAYAGLDETSDAHWVKIKTKSGEPVRYSIQGDWINGRRFARCPSFADWVNELRKAAALLKLK